MDKLCDTCKGGGHKPGCNVQPCPDCSGTGRQKCDPEYERGYNDGHQAATQKLVAAEWVCRDCGCSSGNAVDGPEKVEQGEQQ